MVSRAERAVRVPSSHAVDRVAVDGADTQVDSSKEPTLFPRRVRTRKEPAREGESYWRFMNDSGWAAYGEIRRVLEEWFAMYPAEHRAELRRRFATERRGDCKAPFFELLLFVLLRRLGCDVEVHPKTESVRHPDFLAILPDGSRFYLEAVVAYGVPQEQRSAERRQGLFVDVLNGLEDERYFLSVDFDGELKGQPPVAAFRERIERELRCLDFNELSRVAEAGGYTVPACRWRLEHGGWTVTVEAFVRPPALRHDRNFRPVAIQFPEMYWSRTVAAIRRTVSEKAVRYGQLEGPYVVAVHAVGDGFPVPHDDCIEALFGDETVRYGFPPGATAIEHDVYRARNGVWMGPDGPRNTRLSACLIMSHLYPSNVPTASVALYENPWATHPHECGLSRLPRYRPGAGSKLEKIEGASLGEILGISVAGDWPGPRE